ncbi:protein translocase subunit SecF [Myxococcota bacterium]|nr:protein translocase subunit SecF [Myxococcota bacterium]
MPFELIPPGTHIDFLSRRRICAVISITLLLAGALAVAIKGVRLGIDFAGGTEVQIRFAEGVEVDEGGIRTVALVCGVESADIVRYGDAVDSEYLLRFLMAEDRPAGDASECPLEAEDLARLAASAEAQGGDGGSAEVVDRLSMALGNAVGEHVVQRVEFVGPKVGSELRADGLNAMLLACVLILIYVGFRFSVRFAPGAVVALVHDVGITAGLFVIFGMEFDLRVLAALLAILGYSLNDTIVIYDRIRENSEARTKFDLEDVLNRSVNQTLSRTVLTSGTTLVAVLCLLFLGGEVLRPFAIAMVIGVVVGTYSSVFIAAPTLLWLETRMNARSDGKARA